MRQGSLENQNYMYIYIHRERHTHTHAEKERERGWGKRITYFKELAHIIVEAGKS